MAIKENLSLIPQVTLQILGHWEQAMLGALGGPWVQRNPVHLYLFLWRRESGIGSAFLQYSWEIGKKSETDPKTKHHLQYMSVPTCVPNSVLKTDMRICF